MTFIFLTKRFSFYMKLFNYNKFITESDSFKEAKDIIETLYTICEELTDDNIIWRINPEINDLIKIKIIGLKIYSIWESSVEFFIQVETENLNISQKSKLISTMEDIENYSKSIGLNYYFYNMKGGLSGLRYQDQRGVWSTQNRYEEFNKSLIDGYKFRLYFDI
jgi:hypothetical protein